MIIKLLGPILLSFLLFIVFSFLIINYFRLLKRIDAKFKWILFSCRLITLILLIILILNPWISWRKTYISNPDLNIYLDNSKSISVIEPSVNFNDKMKYINNWGDINDVQINWYLFGDSTRKLNNKNSLFSDKYSSLTGIKKNILLNKNSNHLIITDGHMNKDKKIDDTIIKNYNIYIMGVGDDIDNVDCYISSISGYEDDSDFFDISIALGCHLEEETSVVINCILSDYKDDVILSEKKILNFKNNRLQDIILKDIDRNNLSVLNKINLRTDLKELSNSNNSKYFTIQKKEESKPILILSGAISSNTKFIKRIVKNKFPNFKVDHYFGEKKINQKSLDDYYLIILDNFPFLNKHINDYNYFINNLDIPIIYFEGPGLLSSISKKISKSLGVSSILNKNPKLDLEVLSNHSLFSEIDFTKFPPTRKDISWVSSASTHAPIAYFNDESIAAIKSEKLSAVFMPNLFNSSLAESNLFNTDNVEKYIFNTILNEYEGESELIQVELKDIDYIVDNYIDANININERIIDEKFYLSIYDLLNESSQKIEIGSINLNDGIYSFVIDKPSTYSVQVLSELENSNFSSNKEYLVVSDFDIESEFLYQNKKSLYSFANKNNATYFDFKDLELSLDEIRINEVINVEQNNFNSLDTQYYWIFFIFLLTIEWYIRKKSKLL